MTKQVPSSEGIFYLKHMSKIEERVSADLLARAKRGKSKYGTTMEREDLTLLEWMQHLQEELMDAAVYIEKIKQDLHYQDLESTNEGTSCEELNLRNLAREEEDPAGSYWVNGIDPDVAEHNHNLEREKQNQEEEGNYRTVTTSVYPGDVEVTYTILNPS